MTTWSRYSTDVAAEATLAVLPKLWRRDGSMPGVIYCHGFGPLAELEARSPAGETGSMYRLVDTIAEAGYPVLSCRLAGDAWGNPTAVSRLAAAKTYLQGTLGAKAGPVALLAQSMGHVAAMNYTAANRSSVSCVVSSMGVADLSNIHDNGAYGSSIDAAYGGSWTQAANGAASNPLTRAQSGTYSGLPWLGYFGTGDTVCPPTYTQQLAAAIGMTASAVATSGQHDWATVANFSPANVLAFIAAHA